MKAFCSGCGLSSVPSPSSVVTSFPSIEPTGVTQERLAAPLTSTLQAPHCVMAQPYLAPLSSRSLRSTYSSGVSGSASTERIAPLTFRLMAIAGVLQQDSLLRADSANDALVTTGFAVNIGQDPPARDA